MSTFGRTRRSSPFSCLAPSPVRSLTQTLTLRGCRLGTDMVPSAPFSDPPSNPPAPTNLPLQIRPEATGFGTVIFAKAALEDRKESFVGKRCIVTGSGCVPVPLGGSTLLFWVVSTECFAHGTERWQCRRLVAAATQPFGSAPTTTTTTTCGTAATWRSTA